MLWRLISNLLGTTRILTKMDKQGLGQFWVSVRARVVKKLDLKAHFGPLENQDRGMKQAVEELEEP